MAKISKYNPGRRWRLTTVPDKTKVKIWQKTEKNKSLPVYIADEDERHVLDRKTIRKVCKELYRIGLDDLPCLEPEVVYYLLKRRPELANAAGLQKDEIEEIRTFTDKQWELAEIIATMPEIIPPDDIPSHDLKSNEDNSDTLILRRIISICRKVKR